MKKFLRIKSITELHGLLGYDKPRHPLVSIIDYSKAKYKQESLDEVSVVNDFYLVSLKDVTPNELLYGKNYYDFSEGSMFFMSPNQVFKIGMQKRI